MEVQGLLRKLLPFAAGQYPMPVGRYQALESLLKFTITFAGGAVTFLLVAKEKLGLAVPRSLLLPCLASWAFVILSTLFEWYLHYRVWWFYHAPTGEMPGGGQDHAAIRLGAPLLSRLRQLELTVLVVLMATRTVFLLGGLLLTGWIVLTGMP